MGRRTTEIAKRTVLSTNATAVLVPILEKIVHWVRPRIREFFESPEFLIQEWDTVRTDWLTLKPTSELTVRDSNTAVYFLATICDRSSVPWRSRTLRSERPLIAARIVLDFPGCSFSASICQPTR